MSKDQQVAGLAIPMSRTLADPLLDVAAAALDDLERGLLANENRFRQLTRSKPDEDGVVRGFGLDESHPGVAQLKALVEAQRAVHHQAELYLCRVVRKHPLYEWIKGTKGVGEKTAARLLAAIGDPYIRPELVDPDGKVISSGPRTVSALWAYCGLHVLPGRAHDDAQCPVAGVGGDVQMSGVAPKRSKGVRCNWSTIARTRAYVIAEACIKTLREPCGRDDAGTIVHTDDCACSPYRVEYDRRRAHTAVSHPEWTAQHSHNDGMRKAMKEIVKDLWKAGRDYHLRKSNGGHEAA